MTNKSSGWCAHIWKQAGYQVLTAYDGETALHALRRDRPDLMCST